MILLLVVLYCDRGSYDNSKFTYVYFGGVINWGETSVGMFTSYYISINEKYYTIGCV